MAENMPLSEVIKSSLESIKKVLDSNTVMGDPITVLDGTVIVPVSKISVGFASAGAEYNGNKELKTKNFGGGGGTGITVTPVCFIVITKDGEARMLNVDSNSGYSGNEGIVGVVNGVDTLLDRAPGMIDKIKNLFPKKNKKEEKDDTDGVGA